MSHVFISYVHEDTEAVLRLRKVLQVYKIEVWLDKEQIKPGSYWADAIREAIREGLFYIACFSKAYNEQKKTYMNEELTLAIEELRQRSTAQSWFIPVLLDNSEVPDLSIGAGRTLRSLQWVSLSDNWDEGIRRILSVIQKDSARVYGLIHELEDKSARARIKAADDLGTLGGLAEEAVSKLVETLDDENETVQAAAADALGKIGVVNEQVITKLLSLMEREAEDTYSRMHAAKALAELGKPGIIALFKATTGSRIAYDASRSVARIGQPVIAPLLEALDTNLIESEWAALILEDIDSPVAVPELIEALQHKETEVRAAATCALRTILNHTYPDSIVRCKIVSALILRLMIDQDWSVRSEAIKALGIEFTKDAVLALINVIIEPELRVSAIDDLNWASALVIDKTALGMIGKEDFIVTSALIEILGNDKNPRARRLAACALGNIADPVSISALNQAKRDEEEVVRSAAIEALRKLARRDE